MPEHEPSRSRERPRGGAPRPSDIPALEAFLAGPRCPDDAMTYHELQGFLFTVAAAPEMVPPSEFLPLALGEREPGFADAAEAQAIMGGVLALFNEISGGMSDAGASLPEDCPLLDDPVANLEPDAPVSQWSRGFVTGHTWLMDVWNEYLPDEFEDEMGAILLALTFFHSGRMAEELRQSSADHQTLDAMAGHIHAVFPEAVSRYARFGRGIHRALMQQATGPVAPKVGRNEPCPCGSGKKYKRCCAQSH